MVTFTVVETKENVPTNVFTKTLTCVNGMVSGKFAKPVGKSIGTTPQLDKDGNPKKDKDGKTLTFNVYAQVQYIEASGQSECQDSDTIAIIAQKGIDYGKVTESRAQELTGNMLAELTLAKGTKKWKDGSKVDAESAQIRVNGMDEKTKSAFLTAWKQLQKTNVEL